MDLANAGRLAIGIMVHQGHESTGLGRSGFAGDLDVYQRILGQRRFVGTEVDILGKNHESGAAHCADLPHSSLNRVERRGG